MLKRLALRNEVGPPPFACYGDEALCLQLQRRTMSECALSVAAKRHLVSNFKGVVNN